MAHPSYIHSFIHSYTRCQHSHDSLNAKVLIGDETYHVIIDTGVSLVIARPETTARLPDRDLTRPYILQLASGQTFPHLEGSVSRVDMGMAPTDVLGVHC
jgi:hypothetical protein